MAFVDELKFNAEAGHGGNGVVRWRQEKFIPMGGPSGGDGGRGGNVYFRAVKNLTKLADYSHDPEFKAEHGGAGGSQSLHGKNGEDLYIDLPVGSIVHNLDEDVWYEMETENQTVLVLKGGGGGYGNEHFKSSTNTTPYESTNGKEGEKAHFFVEIRLFADAGLIGFPSSGKSSLLNAITNAKSRVAEYHFTTLEPHLGAFFEFVLADIPGLIEGASEGRGLGHKFLKHIKRTKLLIHLVSFEHGDEMMSMYNSIRKELNDYDEDLGNKDEIILLTKSDLVNAEAVEAKKRDFEVLGKPVFTLSLFDEDQIKSFSDNLVKILRSLK